VIKVQSHPQILLKRLKNKQAELIDGGLYDCAHAMKPEAIAGIEYRQVEVKSKWPYYLPEM